MTIALNTKNKATDIADIKNSPKKEDVSKFHTLILKYL